MNKNINEKSMTIETFIMLKNLSRKVGKANTLLIVYAYFNLDTTRSK
jgi:hypothetical protein